MERHARRHIRHIKALNSVANSKLDHAAERDRIQFHILRALAEMPSASGLLLKGGTMLRMCVFPDYRYSEDLDFEWSEISEFAALMDSAMKKASASSKSDIAFLQRGKGRNSAEFQSRVSKGRIRIDVAPITESSPRAWSFQHNWNNTSLKEQNIKIMGHRLPSVAKDKFVCLGARAKGRDFYDLMRLSELADVCEEGWERYVKENSSRTSGQVAPKDLSNVIYANFDEIAKEWEISQNEYLLPQKEDFASVFEKVMELIESLRK